MIEPICTGCNKRPKEIDEYIEAVAGRENKNISPSDYVKTEEGTYNPTNGHFLCTICYIEAGMPSSPEGWKAP